MINIMRDETKPENVIVDPSTGVLYCHNPIQTYTCFSYTSVNLGTGMKWERKVWTTSLQSFKDLLARWNQMLPYAWRYEY